MPTASISAYIVVGPTNANPRRLQRLGQRQRLRATGSAPRRTSSGPASASGRKDHTRSTSPPSSRSATVARALVIVACDLAAVADDPGVGHQPLDVGVVVGRDPVGVEVVERRPERRPLAQDRRPRQPGLERLEADPLEHPALVADRHAPLGVVVLLHQRVRRRPRRAAPARPHPAPSWPSLPGPRSTSVDAMEGHACCAPVGRAAGAPATPSPRAASRRPRGQVPVPAGTFAMGDAFDEGYPADGETPGARRYGSTRSGSTPPPSPTRSSPPSSRTPATSPAPRSSASPRCSTSPGAQHRPPGARPGQPGRRHAVVAGGPRRRLALARGPGLRRHPAAEPPRRARLLVRRAGLRRVGRQAAAHRGGVGVRRPRRPGAARATPGATSSPRAAGGACNIWQGEFPTAQHRATTATSPPRR